MRRQAEIAISTCGRDHPHHRRDAPASPQPIRTLRPCCCARGKPRRARGQQMRHSRAIAPAEFYEFYNLGLGDPIRASPLVHGHGTGELLDACCTSISRRQTRRKRTTSVIQRCSDRQAERRQVQPAQPHAGRGARHRLERCRHDARQPSTAAVDNAHGKFTFIDTAGMPQKVAR